MKRIAGVMLAALALAGCSAQPVPTPTVTVVREVPGPIATVTLTPTAPSSVALTDGQRATLDKTFGRTSDSAGPLLPSYCAMDESGRKYYADLIARQLEGYTVPW